MPSIMVISTGYRGLYRPFRPRLSPVRGGIACGASARPDASTQCSELFGGVDVAAKTRIERDIQLDVACRKVRRSRVCAERGTVVGRPEGRDQDRAIVVGVGDEGERMLRGELKRRRELLGPEGGNVAQQYGNGPVAGHRDSFGNGGEEAGVWIIDDSRAEFLEPRGDGRGRDDNGSSGDGRGSDGVQGDRKGQL
jgi:hypothetical protein